MPQFPSVIDLSALTGSAGANPGFRLDGIDAGDSSGRSVASAGDVNGDGFADLIIGALRADPGGDDEAGASYVVFGRASGFATSLDLATLDGTNGFRLDGIDAFDRSGASAASAGDVNGDGFADILIGAFGGEPGGDTYSGESYVVFGKASGFAASLDLAGLDGTNGFRLDGIDAYDRSGRSVASAGDVNGDGFDDIVIGAFGVTACRRELRRVRQGLGSATSTSRPRRRTASASTASMPMTGAGVGRLGRRRQRRRLRRYRRRLSATPA